MKNPNVKKKIYALILELDSDFVQVSINSKKIWRTHWKSEKLEKRKKQKRNNTPGGIYKRRADIICNWQKGEI